MREPKTSEFPLCPGLSEFAAPCVFVVLHWSLARKLVVADWNFDAAYFMLVGAGQSQWLAFRKKTKKHTTPTRKFALGATFLPTKQLPLRPVDLRSFFCETLFRVLP